MGKIIKVREVGDPVLNKISEEVDITNINNDILDIIDDLKATLEDGVGLGIAAPQIGISKRIIVVGAKKENVRYNDAEDIPLTAMINPKWEKSAPVHESTAPTLPGTPYPFWYEVDIHPVGSCLIPIQNYRHLWRRLK